MRRAIQVPAWPALVLLILVGLVFQHGTLNLAFALIVLRQAAPLGVATLGQSLTVIGRSLDLSVGGVIAVTNVVLTLPAVAHNSALLSILLPLVIGAGVGLINAIFIAGLRASAVIVTLGVSVALEGISYLITGGAPGGDINPFVKLLAIGKVGGFPIATLIWFLLTAALSLVAARSVFGRSLYAIGSNYRAAALGGARAREVLAGAHLLSGLCAGAAGLLLTGYIGTGTMDLGADLVLSSVAACILGGVTFGGGRGNLVGTAGGAVTLIFLGTLLTALGVAEPIKLIVQGLIVAVASAAAARR
jgi:ribose transport system permease protein